MGNDKSDTSIAADVSEFMEFYAKHLGELQFPDVDLERLGELAGQVKERAAEVARLNEQARAAREALEEAQAMLRKSAERGLAYARVYAQGNNELAGKLSELELASEPVASKPGRKRRGRPKGKAAAEPGKQSATKEPTAELPFAGSKPATASKAAAARAS